MHVVTVIRQLALIGLMVAGLTWPNRTSADETRTDRFVVSANEAFEQGQGAWGVRLDEAGAVCLYDRMLVEDDGPGIGSDADWLKTDRAPATEIAGSTRAKKVLHIERLGAGAAWLCAPAGVGVEINGRALEASPRAPFREVPVSLLQPGDNAVVLYSLGNSRSHVKIARTEDILRNAPDRQGWPCRSFKSADGGKNWERIPGEYFVRLHLVQYLPQGHFISPVIDLGQAEADKARLPTPVSIQSVSLRAEAETPEATRVEMALRTGSSPVYEPNHWSDWQPPGSPVPNGSRYLQWKATLFSGEPLKTPRLRRVAIEAKVSRSPAPAWANTLRVVSLQNAEVRYTSLPFAYEDPLHPRLVALRKKYKLDEVVSGAGTELERLVRLRDWVAHQWKYQPPVENYPAWDADAILSRRCGFCVQYAITFMQCAISLGHQARFVFGHNPGAFDGGGHEVCEVWSNEHRKWVFFDVNGDWHYVDPRTRAPMSLLEVHDLILQTYYGAPPSAPADPPRRRVASDAIAICYGTSLIPGRPPPDYGFHYADGRYTVPTRWLFVHYMPRNNFLAQPYPQPKTQGAHWDWSEYWCWEDARTPQRWLYRNFTARRSDLNWTINQVRFDATLAGSPRTVALRMGTVTPYFDSFRVSIDRQSWKESPPDFTWILHRGRNRAEMRSRNQAGIEGPISALELDY